VLAIRTWVAPGGGIDLVDKGFWKSRNAAGLGGLAAEDLMWVRVGSSAPWKCENNSSRSSLDAFLPAALRKLVDEIRAESTVWSLNPRF
jgi:hypothetical protein